MLTAAAETPCMRPIVNERSCGSSSAGVSSFFREYFGPPNFPFPHRRPRRKIPGVIARSVYSKFSPTGEWHDAHALDSGRRCLVLRLVGVSQRNGNQKTVPALQPLTNREASLIEATGLPEFASEHNARPVSTPNQDFARELQPITDLLIE